MNSRKHEEILCVARSESKSSGCVRMVLAAFALLLSLHAHAAQGYAVLSADKTTLTFKYGTPSGTVNTDYFDTDNTNFKMTTSNIWGITTYYIITENKYPIINKIIFDSSFASARPKSCAFWFCNMKYVTTITGIEYLNTSSVTDMSNMFYNCSGLTSLDVTKFDTRNVTNMSGMFSGCSGLPSLDVSTLDTRNVTNMSGMFSGCSGLPSLDVSTLDTRNVTNMSGMFQGCSGLPSLDVSTLDTRNVTNMSGMFSGCSGLPSLDVSTLDTRNVTKMSGMFSGCSGLPSLDVSTLDTGNVTDMSNMFSGCRSLSSLDVSTLDTGNVTNMSGMFSGCRSLLSLNVTKFDTGNVTDMSNMFEWCSSLPSLDVSNFDTRNVTDMSYMFHFCSSLPSLDVSTLDTRNVTNMSYMFSYCSGLHSLDLRNFDTRQLRDTYRMFEMCEQLKSVVFGKNFSMEKFTIRCFTMFYYDFSLRYVDFYDSDYADINSLYFIKMFDGSYTDNPNFVVYLPHGSQEIKDRTNFVYSNNGNANDLVCPKYYSVDKVDIEFPRQFRTNEAVYDRTATMGSKEYGSVILPFEFKSNSDIQAYSLNEQNKEMTNLKFVSVQTVARHTPFAFKRLGKAEFVMKDDSGNFGITVYPVRSTNKSEGTWTVAGGAPEATPGSPYTGSTGLSNWKTKGYYVKETVNDYAGMYFVQNDDFKRAVGPLNLVDHRVLFYPTDGSGAASFFSLSFEEDDIATAIEAAETEHVLSEAAAIYDASGCRLEEARKGLNIVRMSDGTVRKVFIK